MAHRTWNRDRILRTLRQLHRAKADLSYNALARRDQALLSAAVYHFKSYRHAVLMAGLDYAAIRRKPAWTKTSIAAILRDAHWAGVDLSWRRVSARRDKLGRAAASAVHGHLFGSWTAALRAARLNPRSVARYQRRSGDDVVRALQARIKRARPVNAGALQESMPSLYASAVRRFGSFASALRAAGIDPNAVQRRRVWTRKSVVQAMRQFAAEHGRIGRGLLRRNDSGLLRAILLEFGTIRAALKAAGLQGKAAGASRSGRAKQRVG